MARFDFWAPRDNQLGGGVALGESCRFDDATERTRISRSAPLVIARRIDSAAEHYDAVDIRRLPGRRKTPLQHPQHIAAYRNDADQQKQGEDRGQERAPGS